MSPSQMIHDLTSGGSRTTLRAEVRVRVRVRGRGRGKGRGRIRPPCAQRVMVRVRVS